VTVGITIGADPEFGYLDNGRLVTPRTVCPNLGEAFGVDGCSSIAELRPKYGSTPGELTENIRKVLMKGVKDNPNVLPLHMKAGGFVGDNAIGGHIHFGHDGLLNENKRMALNKALNRTVAVLVMMVEDPSEAINRRVGTGYGSIEDRSYNPQDWGVEYRVLPSWLTHPKECESILSAAFILASEFQDEEILDDAQSLPGFNTQAFKECDKLQLLYHIPPIVKFMRKLPLYEKYEDQVNYLFRMIKDRSCWSFNANMLDTWGLREAVAEPKKKRESSLV
jgi:hypothetical protein